MDGYPRPGTVQGYRAETPDDSIIHINSRGTKILQQRVTMLLKNL